LAFTAGLQPIQIFPFPGSQVRIGTMSTVLVGAVLLVDLFHELRGGELLDQFRDRMSELNWNLILATAALLVGGEQGVARGLIYERYVPLNLKGCRWTRFPPKEAALLAFLTANAQQSSDCVIARIGLISLNFWTDRRPPGTFVFGNEWEGLDPDANERLLSSYRDRMQLMFIDNPKPWYLKTHNLDFSSFVAAQPSHKFLDFVSQHFKQLARVSSCRLLVRKERTHLDLVDCAYEAGLDSQHKGRSLLRIKLPAGAELNGVTSIDLVDLQTGAWLGSTAFDDRTRPLLQLDVDGEQILRNGPRSAAVVSLQSDQDLLLSYPTRLRLDRMPFPAIRFLNFQGGRLLTLPVAVETSLVK